MGDFNINLLNYNNDEDTTTFLDTIVSNSFSPIMTLPTRVGNTSETLIDNIVDNKPLSDMIAGNLCSVISDHLIQFLIESSSYMHNSSKEKITKRWYKKFDKEKFKSDFIVSSPLKLGGFLIFKIWTKRGVMKKLLR